MLGRQAERGEGPVLSSAAAQIYAEEFGSIRGHFGPINALKFHPDGRSFASGGEDGYVRIHHLDSEYLGIQL